MKYGIVLFLSGESIKQFKICETGLSMAQTQRIYSMVYKLPQTQQPCSFMYGAGATRTSVIMTARCRRLTAQRSLIKCTASHGFEINYRDSGISFCSLIT